MNKHLSIFLTIYQGPNANAYAERFVRSIKHERLNKIINFGYRSLWRSLREYQAYYKAERNHQGVGNELLSGRPSPGQGDLVVTERLGGLLKYYHRPAA